LRARALALGRGFVGFPKNFYTVCQCWHINCRSRSRAPRLRLRAAQRSTQTAAPRRTARRRPSGRAWTATAPRRPAAAACRAPRAACGGPGPGRPRCRPSTRAWRRPRTGTTARGGRCGSNYRLGVGCGAAAGRECAYAPTPRQVVGALQSMPVSSMAHPGVGGMRRCAAPCAAPSPKDALCSAVARGQARPLSAAAAPGSGRGQPCGRVQRMGSRATGGAPPLGAPHPRARAARRAADRRLVRPRTSSAHVNCTLCRPC